MWHLPLAAAATAVAVAETADEPAAREAARTSHQKTEPPRVDETANGPLPPRRFGRPAPDITGFRDCSGALERGLLSPDEFRRTPGFLLSSVFPY